MTKTTQPRRSASHEPGFKLSQAVPLLFDYYSALSMVFGGCCVNVLVYEQLLLMNPRIGSALTFSQMAFIALQTLPAFLHVPKGATIPRLRPRNIPFREWALQVLVMSTASLLNNWAYAFKVPMTLMIIFRSGGLAVSMLIGKLVMKRSYSVLQVASVTLVTIGVAIATLYRPSTSSKSENSTHQVLENEDIPRYTTGIAMMTASLFLSAIHGLMQERAYTKWGPHWKEGVFYNHALSLPIFLFLRADVEQGFHSLSHNAYFSSPWQSYSVLGVNLISQLVCVSGVNKLSSQTSSVSTNLILTVRKAISLMFSIWWFGNGYNLQLGFGSLMVFSGGILFTFSSDPKRSVKANGSQPHEKAKAE